jgi:hypothetical protein
MPALFTMPSSRPVASTACATTASTAMALRHIRRDEGAADGLSDRPAAFREIGDHHVCAASRDRLHDARTDTLRASGNDDGLAGQILAHAAYVLVVGEITDDGAPPFR